MGKFKVFEYVIYFEPNNCDGNEKPVILKRDIVLATDEKNALIAASRFIPDEYENRLDEVKVLTRPF